VRRVLLFILLVLPLLTSCNAGSREEFNLPVDGTPVSTSKLLEPYVTYTIRISSPRDLRPFMYEDKGFLGIFESTYYWNFNWSGADASLQRHEEGPNGRINHLLITAQGAGKPFQIKTSKDFTGAFDAPTLSVQVFRKGWGGADDGTSIAPLIYVVLGIVGIVFVCKLIASVAGPTTYYEPVRVTPEPPRASQPDPLTQRLLSWVTQHERWLLEHENCTDPSYQKNLLWRHRRAYHEAMRTWIPGAHTLELPPYPMAIPIAEWRTSCDALNDRDLCEYLAAHESRLLHILKAMEYLCQEAEKEVIRPSVINDHLTVLESQLAQINAINAKALEMQDSIRANGTLTAQEQNAQIKWIQQLRDQCIQELLKEDDDGTSKDEVISPE